VRPVSWQWAWEGEVTGRFGMAFLPSGLVHVTASVARPGHDLVLLDEPEAPRPKGATMEVRASGLWADAIEEELAERWTIGLEAFALAVDDPEDVVGHRVPLGFDLEWERSDPDVDGRTPAHVHGEVLVGDDEIDLDADGWWTEGHQ
jgi:hypothetical protein